MNDASRKFIVDLAGHTWLDTRPASSCGRAADCKLVFNN